MTEGTVTKVNVTKTLQTRDTIFAQYTVSQDI